MNKLISLLTSATLLFGALPALAQDASSSSSSSDSSVSSSNSSSSVSSSGSNNSQGNAWGRRCKEQGKTGIVLAACVKAMNSGNDSDEKVSATKKMAVRKAMKKKADGQMGDAMKRPARRAVKGLTKQAVKDNRKNRFKKVMFQRKNGAAGTSASSSSAAQ